MSDLVNVLELDSRRQIVSGSTKRLNQAIAAGADLRVSTGFRHNEHIDVTSTDNQLIVETSAFAQTVLIDGIWSAAFMTLRQPVSLRSGFGSPNALSLFLYNQDGSQALARLNLDGTADMAIPPENPAAGFQKMHVFGVFDSDTSGASRNFIYDFDFYRYLADDGFEELYENDADGGRRGGSVDSLADAYARGRAIKVSLRGISKVLWGDTGHEDEIFIPCGSSYYYTQDRLMITNTLPFVSVPAGIPLQYQSRSYRYCWAVTRTDGRTEIRCLNPFDGTWQTKAAALPGRWFAAK